MKKTKVVIKNILALAAGGLVTRLLFILTELIIARSMGAEVFGQFSTALAYTTIFGFCMNIGVDFYLVKAASQDSKTIEWVFGNTLLIKTINTVILYLAMLVLAVYLKYSTETFLLIQIFGFYTALLAFQETFSAVSQANQQMEKIAFYRSLQMLLLVVLVYFTLNKGVIACALVYSAVAGAFTLIWFVDTIKQCRPKLKIKKIGFIIKNSYMFGLSAILFMLNYRADTVMLSVMRSEAEVGFYSVAYKFVDVFIKVPIILSMAIMPVLFRLSKKGSSSISLIYDTMITYLALLVLPLVTCLFLFAESFIRVLFGTDFMDSASALKILCWSLVSMSLLFPASDQLNAANKQNLVLIGWTIALIINLGFNFFLIPLYGITGASWATFISLFSLFVIFSYFLWKVTGQTPISKKVMKPFVATIAFAIPIYFLRDLLGLVGGISAAFAIFFTMIMTLKFFGPEDIHFIQSLLKKTNPAT